MAVTMNFIVALAIIATAFACGPNDKKDKPPSTFQMAQGVKEGDGFEGEAKGMLGNYWMDVKYSLHRLVRPPAQTEDHKKGNGKEAKKEDSELPRKFKDRNYA